MHCSHPIAAALAALFAALLPSFGQAEEPVETKRVAAVVSVYHHNAHADVIVGRLLQTHTLDGRGRVSPLELVSIYIDQFPENDIGRKLMAEHGVPIYPTVAEALELGTGALAVDGVLLVAEHGAYPASDTGQTVYPKRRLFEQVAAVVERSGRAVPVFCDKHLADNWTDAKWFYDTAGRLEIPLMAGSSLPLTYRRPSTDVARGAKLKEIVAVSYHTLDAYGFHAVEAVQSLAERRAGGETGVAAVQCITGEAVWQAGEQGVYDRELLAAAIARLSIPPRGELKEIVPEPSLMVIDYTDGLRANILTLNGGVQEWSAGWRYADGRTDSTLFYVQEARPFTHFSLLLTGIEQMMLSGQPTWPAERTLLSSGMLDALHISRRDGGVRLETPYLNVQYQSEWDWTEPPPAPPDRPIEGQ